MAESNDRFLTNVGSRIRTIRKSRGLSQEQLAAEAGLDRAYYGRIERGEVNVAALNLQKIAKVLHATVGDFFPNDRQKATH